MKTAWLKAAAIRSIKTMAQSAIACIGTGAVGITDIDWAGMVSIVLVSGLLSVLTSVAGLPEVDADREA